ncbi:hypothetical protein LPJ53_005747 [Coemansia erecta]|uniref:Glycosyl transferase family 25 domain-containing protein n=1 Tax=Coemansia erecta TaxID=147472 RepID=A0A9W7XW34_9FUNG|nr:hypothetical protein LPJ53_005747 [Coemansia erecta]
MGMLFGSFSRRLALLAGLLSAALLVLLLRRPASLSTAQPDGAQPASSDAQNSTLGFHKILVLNTPQRRDRLRNMQALARHHSLRLEYPGTVGAQEADALAESQGYLLRGTHLACYLSHLRALRQVVARRLATALILEDDVDLELDLKALHARAMQQVHRTAPDWDMLFLGHCTRDAREPDTGAGSGLEVYRAEYPMCLHAYAVSWECARRLVVLLEERLRTVGREIDLVLAVGVQFGVDTVLGVSPPYVVQVGRRELGSDLTAASEGDTGQHLRNSTLYHLGLRQSNPQTLAAYIG